MLLLQVCGAEKQAGGASLASGAMRPAHGVDQMVSCMDGLAVTKPGAMHSCQVSMFVYACHSYIVEARLVDKCLLPAGPANQPLSGASARAMPGMPSQQAGIFQRQGASQNGMPGRACLQS